jgi:hypothetical protein
VSYYYMALMVYLCYLYLFTYISILLLTNY